MAQGSSRSSHGAWVPRPNPASSASFVYVFFRKPNWGQGQGQGRGQGQGPGPGHDSRQGWRGGGTGERRGEGGGRGRGMFRNGPRRGILMICLLHILRPAERMSCARGTAWRFGNGIQRRALPGPEDCLLFSDLAGAICLLDRAAGR